MADGQSQNTLHENSLGWMILFVVLTVLGSVFWYYFHVEIRNMIRWIRYGEMWIISWFIPSDYTITFNGQTVNWHKGFQDAAAFSDKKLSYFHLSYFAHLSMYPLKYGFMGICGLGALWAMLKGPGTQYKIALGLDGLIHRQAPNFPAITPFIKFNPSKQPPRAPGSPVPAELPCFAEALGAEEWIAYNNIPIPDGKVDESAVRRALLKQLGRRWKGAKSLKPHEQILLAAFCLKAARKRDQSDTLLGRLACCWSFPEGLRLKKDKKLLKEARAILANKKISGATLEKVNQHAFTTTALLRGMQTAREEGGVLAPAQFVWLRGYDRNLWYPLNSLGRQSYHTEALGAMSHFRVEKITQRPVPVPKLEDSITTIRNYFASGKARPIPPLDYSNSKKKSIKKAK